MSIIYLSKKIKTQVDFEIIEAVFMQGICYVKVDIVNYFSVYGSLGSFQYSTDLGTSWHDCTLYNTSVYTEQLVAITGIDKDAFGLSGNKRRIAFAWDSITDLSCILDFYNIKIRMTFYDQASQAGNETDAVEYTITRSYLCPSGLIPLIRPYPSENLLDIEFWSIVSYAVVNCHFKVECDKVLTFDSGDYLAYNSEADQTGWTVGGDPFPIAGTPSVTSAADREIIKYTNAALQALAEDDYYFRIITSLHDPAGLRNPGVWNPVELRFE
jgi:hypothetical protein